MTKTSPPEVVSCGHPVDVWCSACPYPYRSARQLRIEHLDAAVMGLNLRGTTDGDREECARLFEELQDLRREEREDRDALRDECAAERDDEDDEDFDRWAMEAMG